MEGSVFLSRWLESLLVKNFWRIFPSLILILASGCSSTTSTRQLATFIPEEQLPTAVALTAEALSEGENPLPTATPPIPPAVPSPTLSIPTQTPTIQPTAASASPTLTPTPTITILLDDPQPVALPDPIPYGAVQFISPGPLSRVTSPFNVHVFLDPGENRLVQISLYGEDGRLLVRHQQNFQETTTQRVHLKMYLSFEISRNEERARLEVSTQDAHGRISALASTDLILLSAGEISLKPLGDLYENIILQQPLSRNLVQGETVLVKGLTRRAPQDQLVVEVYNRGGGLVGSKVIRVETEDLGAGYRFFVGDVPLSVGSSSWVRVQVIARDGQLSGVQHISSVEVLASP